MDKVVKRFSSFRESDEADRRYYLSLTPAQRLDILLELNARCRDEWHDAPQGLERVYRIIRAQLAGRTIVSGEVRAKWGLAPPADTA